MLVEELRDARVGEGFGGHDVAPVAGRVADAHEEETVGLAGECEGGGVPELPGGGVGAVGADVGGGALEAAVGEEEVVVHCADVGVGAMGGWFGGRGPETGCERVSLSKWCLVWRLEKEW